MRTHLKNGRKSQKNAVLIYYTLWIIYVGKVPKIIFEKLIEKLINFEVFLVGKVPKIGVFNRDCLENSKFEIWKNHENQKWVK